MSEIRETKRTTLEPEASLEDATKTYLDTLNINHEIFKSEMLDDTTQKVIDRINRLWHNEGRDA